jgi:cytochrome bd-type quinol oxidase subunit 2
MTLLFFVCAFLALCVMYWRYMVPYSITAASAATAEASLRLLFWAAGLFVLPAICIYTIAVYPGSSVA